MGVAMYPVDTTVGAAARLRARGYRTVPVGTALGSNLLRVVDERLTRAGLGTRGVGRQRPVRDGRIPRTGRPVKPAVSRGYAASGPAFRTGSRPHSHERGNPNCLAARTASLKSVGTGLRLPEWRKISVPTRRRPRRRPVDCREQGEVGFALIAWVDAAGVDEVRLRIFPR